MCKFYLKQYLCLLLLIGLIIISSFVSFAQDDNQHNNIQLENSLSQTPSIQEIRDKYNELKPVYSNDFSEIYSIRPKLEAPYDPGQLKSQYLVDGLNAVNFVRYLAGVPSDVTLDHSKDYQQQAAALVNSLNNQLSHEPNRPNNIDDTLFNIASIGSKSNLCFKFYGNTYHNLYDAVKSYMSDNSTSTIDSVGHRRWVIDPLMKVTTFGQVNAYSSMYTGDNTRNPNSFDYSNINWPSKGNFPIEFFDNNDPWSVSLNTNKVDKTRTNDIKITLTRTNDNKVWNFDKSDTNKEGKYFNINTTGYGIPFCIIFRPDNINEYKNNDEFEVGITGLYDNDGNPITITYKTIFFDL